MDLRNITADDITALDECEMPEPAFAGRTPHPASFASKDESKGELVELTKLAATQRSRLHHKIS